MAANNLIDLVPEYVRRFTPYVPSLPDDALMRRYGVTSLLRLNNNENPLGPPPAACEVIRSFPAERAALYPSGDCHGLRLALSGKFDKAPDRFLVGNGSCEVIAAVIKAFCEPGDNIVTADKTFAVYEWVAEFSGIEPRLIPLVDGAFDPAGLLNAMDGRTKIIFLCNPNNPTGAWWDEATLSAFLDAVGGRCAVVLDEAYCEYVENPEFPDGMRLMERHDNLFVFRTFSKMYGLAGLRIGYLCGSAEGVDIVRRTHIVYSVNALAQEAARAALTDGGDHIKASRRMTEAARERLRVFFADQGLPVMAGQGNFIMARASQPDTLLYRKLIKRGIMVRTMTGFRFPNWFRVTLGPEPWMEAFCQAFSQLAEAGAASAQAADGRGSGDGG